MTITIEQATDLVVAGPGSVREKIIAGIEAYVDAAQKAETVGTIKELRLEDQPAAPDKVAMLVEALEDALNQLEEWEVKIDGEWGACRKLEDIPVHELSAATLTVRAALATVKE